MTKFPTEHFRSIVPFLALGIVRQLISFSKCLAQECVLSRKHERRVKFSWQRDGSMDLATIQTQLTCMYIAYLCYIWDFCTKYMQMDGFCLPLTVGQKHSFLPPVSECLPPWTWNSNLVLKTTACLVCWVVNVKYRRKFNITCQRNVNLKTLKLFTFRDLKKF